MASPDPEAAPDAGLPVCVAALYQFTRFPDAESLKAPLLALCEGLSVKGTLLLANEGLNGTLAGSDAAIGQLLDHVRALPGCAALDVKYSRAAALPRWVPEPIPRSRPHSLRSVRVCLPTSRSLRLRGCCR
jgi:UPF0176 protein